MYYKKLYYCWGYGKNAKGALKKVNPLQIFTKHEVLGPSMVDMCKGKEVKAVYSSTKSLAGYDLLLSSIIQQLLVFRELFTSTVHKGHL